MSHIEVDVPINIFIFEDHKDLPLLSYFVKDVPHYIHAQNVLPFILESHVQKNLLDCRRLYQLSSGLNILRCIIKSFLLFNSSFFKVLCPECFRSFLIGISIITVLSFFEATFGNHLTKHKELDVLMSIQLLSEEFDQVLCWKRLHLVIFHLSNVFLCLPNLLVIDLSRIFLNNVLHQVSSEIIFPEVKHISNDIHDQNW